jgi:hypothetical protein
MQSIPRNDIVYCRLDDAPSLHAPLVLAHLASNRNPAATNFMTLAHRRAAAFKRARRG